VKKRLSSSWGGTNQCLFFSILIQYGSTCTPRLAVHLKGVDSPCLGVHSTANELAARQVQQQQLQHVTLYVCGRPKSTLGNLIASTYFSYARAQSFVLFVSLLLSPYEEDLDAETLAALASQTPVRGAKYPHFILSCLLISPTENPNIS
jgi:hypothetical protein